MNTLLIFFALPVATIILAIVLQKILNNPLLVAATFFAIYLIVTFVAFDSSFLVFAILYTILAFVTALLTKAICKLIKILYNSNCRITERPAAYANIRLLNQGEECNNDSTNIQAQVTSSNNNMPGVTYCCNCRRIRR